MKRKWVVIGIACTTVFLGFAACGMYRRSDAYAYRQCLQEAREHYARGQYQSCADNYEAALVLQPESPEAQEGYFDARLALAREKLSRGEYHTALYKWLLQTRPGESGLYVEAAQLFLMREEYLQALAILQEGYRETGDGGLLEKEAYVRANIRVRSEKKRRPDMLPRTVYYAYDAKGNVLTEDHYTQDQDAPEEWTEGFVYTYDEAGRMLLTRSHAAPGESLETTYEYDEAGREILRLNRDLEQGTWFCRYTTYDGQGRVCKIEKSHGEEDSRQDFRDRERWLETLHVYEEQEGGYLEMESRYEEGALWMLWMHRYDEAGNCIESEEYLQDAEKSLVLPEDAALWEMSPREAENLAPADWLERWRALDPEAEENVTYCARHIQREYDGWGNLILEEEEGCIRTWEYDEKQRVVSESVHYSDRAGGSNTYIYWFHEYNELGQCVKTTAKTVTQSNGESYMNTLYEYTYLYAGEDLWKP